MEVYNLINKNTGKPVVNQIVIVDGVLGFSKVIKLS